MKYRDIIIDGLNYYYKTYYINTQIISYNNKNVNIGGITGFISFLKWVEENLCDNYYRVHICFDTIKGKGRKNQRKQIDPEYKSNRESKPDEFYFGYERLQEILLHFSSNYTMYMHDEFEADDFVPKIIEDCRNRNTYNLKLSGNVLLCSSDSDWSRSIDDDVFHFKNKKIISKKKFFEINEFYPNVSSISLWKALKTDKADNIKSPLKKVMKQEALCIIKNCKDMNDLEYKVDKLDLSKSLKEDIKTNINKLKLNYKLVDFLPLDDYNFDISKIKCTDNKIVRKEIYNKLQINIQNIEPELLNIRSLNGGKIENFFFEDEKIGRV